MNPLQADPATQELTDDVVGEDESNEPPEELEADDIAKYPWQIANRLEVDDFQAHTFALKEALKGEHYWANRQYIFTDTSETGVEIPTEDDDSQLYTANEYRPNGESIIAAMAVQPPQVNFFPDDADNAADVIAANAYARIAKLIMKHNYAQNLIVRMLYLLYNEHFVAVYNYAKSSHKFGTYQTEDKSTITKKVISDTCPNCGSENIQPGQMGGYQCLDCQESFDNPEQQENEIEDEVINYKDNPKTRICLHAFGPIHVKVAPYVQTLDDSPYLILKFEQHPSRAKYQFSEFADKLTNSRSAGLNDTAQERAYRAAMYRGRYDKLDTWTIIWLRPWLFKDAAEGDKLAAYFKANYSEGVKATYVNDVLVEIENESMDEHWTLSENPLSTFLYAEPLGKAGLSLQDATNFLLNISMDTIAHGVPQTFVSTEILDLNAYKQSDAKPGDMVPTKTLPAGRSIRDFIETVRTATLSQEVAGVRDAVKQQAQLSTGAFPSIYGGNIQGSRTASEYAQSRAQALQRLSLTWNMLKVMWAKVMGKACTEFAEELKAANYDEKFVQKQGSSFLNVWIKAAELTGRIGEVEPEVDEQLPTSWAQIRDLLTRLIEMNNPLVNEVIADHENAVVVKGSLGLQELHIPGYDDVLMEKAAIQELIANPMADPMPDSELMDINIAAATCRNFLISETGMGLKLTNSEAYGRVRQRYSMYVQLAQAQAMKAAAAQNPQGQMQPPPPDNQGAA